MGMCTSSSPKASRAFGFSPCILGHSYSFPLLNEITLHVSILLVPKVDAGVSTELMSDLIILLLSVEAIC